MAAAQGFTWGNTVYLDEGCRYAPSCLACPFARCLEEVGQKRDAWIRHTRIAEALAGGLTVDEAAARFGVSRRQVFRALRRVREEVAL